MARKWRSDLELRRASSCHDGTSACHRLYTMAPLAAAASPLFGLLRRPSEAGFLLLRKPLEVSVKLLLRESHGHDSMHAGLFAGLFYAFLIICSVQSCDMSKRAPVFTI
jgi:hypothetical protein